MGRRAIGHNETRKQGLPSAFANVYPGPQFAISGSRELTGVYGRPIIGTIVKPALGLLPEETAELVQADVDFIKDDEKLASPPYFRS